MRPLTLAVLIAFALCAVGTFSSAGPALAQTEPQPSTQSTETTPPSPREPAREPAREAPGDGKAEAERVAAQPVILGLPKETSDAIQRIGATLDQFAHAVEEARNRDEDLLRLRAQIEASMRESQALAVAVAPRLQAIRSQIEKLGPAPGKDAPREAPAIADERTRLTSVAAEADGAIRTMEVAQVRGRQLVSRIQELRQKNFTGDLLRRTQSPVKPGVWVEFAHEISMAMGDFGDILRNWWDRVAPRPGEFWAVIAIAVAFFTGARMVSARLIEHYLQPPRSELPTFFEQARAAILSAPTRLLPGAGAALISYLGLDSLDLLGLQVGLLSEGALTSFLIYAGVSALVGGTFAVDRPCWRLFDLSDRSATALARRVRALALIYAGDIFLRGVISTLSLSLPVGVATALFTSIAFSAVVGAIVRTPFERRGGDQAVVDRYRPRWVKIPLAASAVAVIAASLFGFVALGRFIAGQVLLTGSALLILYMMHLAIREASRLPMETHLGSSLDEKLGLGVERRGQISAVVAFLLHVALALFGLPLVLLTWGYSAPDILDMLRALVFGFEIGQFRISLARLVIAVVLFGLILLVTRLAQKWLDARVLPAANVDSGISNSVLTGLGYAGFATAVLVAVSFAGLDVTNLAIVAGALSVGIGFGLQSIVNNFVSGLILLVERPIKVGDWIVLNNREGIVRRISVRSTEIETFDRSSVIVPNSELVTSSVQNWTHRNSVGRLTIKIGTAYRTDPQVVMDELLAIARAHPDVMAHPAPFVTFENFGANSLDFSLRMFLADVMTSLRVQTEIRVSIWRRFGELGIEIPYQQADVHLRDLDGVKTMLLQALKARQAPTRRADGTLEPEHGSDAG